MMKGTIIMKVFRPHNSGFIVMYALAALSIVDTGYTLYGQITGNVNQYMGTFSFFSYLITAVALCYVYLFARAQVCVDGNNLRAAFLAYIQPPDGSRAMIVFRQGPLDMKLIDKTFPIQSIERYGYVDDFKLSRVDRSNATDKSPLLPVKEVCFLTKDGKRYHMNAGVYSKKQLREMFTLIRQYSGVAPEGSLAEVLK